MELEVRIPISPAPYFFNRVYLIARSLRMMGVPFKEVRIRVSVGADQEPENLGKRLPWSENLGVEWCWVKREDFRQWKDSSSPHLATIMHRFRPPFDASHILFLDSDVLPVSRFDELIDLSQLRPGMCGVMAHVSPFCHHRESWQELFRRFGIAPPRFVFEHSGWGIMDLAVTKRFGPAYFNSGVLLAPAAVLSALYEIYLNAIESVSSAMDVYFVDQIALTLALYRLSAPIHILPLFYNWPNDPLFDRARPEALKAVRFIHFLRTEQVQRDAHFQSRESIAEFISRQDLSGSNELLRARVARVFDERDLQL